MELQETVRKKSVLVSNLAEIFSCWMHLKISSINSSKIVNADTSTWEKRQLDFNIYQYYSSAADTLQHFHFKIFKFLYE
jgi:hypothetical protein